MKMQTVKTGGERNDNSVYDEKERTIQKYIEFSRVEFQGTISLR